jgi:F0F1-type ATP synthase assembly protein I
MPAKIYFAIAVIASVIALFSGLGIMMVAMKLVFAFIWTFVLGWLCDQGFKSLSWFLVLLPYIFIALAMFGVYQMTRGQRQLMRSVKMHGAYGQEPMSYKM